MAGNFSSVHLGAFVIVLGEILLSWHDPRIRQSLGGPPLPGDDRRLIPRKLTTELWGFPSMGIVQYCESYMVFRELQKKHEITVKWGFPSMGDPQNGGCIREHPIKKG